jgi:2-dehydropantoate 2-reductase
MRIVVIGAGALGASFGARIAATGHAVTLVDRWQEHVAAIAEHGLKALGVPAPVEIRLPARLPDTAPGNQDLALIAVDANGTAEAAAIAARLLARDGCALTLQNGIGNIETLSSVLGHGRVLGGTTMCSFRTIGPGVVEQTNVSTTVIGELDGQHGARVARFAELLTSAGYPTDIITDVTAAVWKKLIVNVTINPICGITGLRMGELARLPATNRYQDLLLEEAFAVARAKGLSLPEEELREQVKAHCWDKYSQPSMLQHLETGRRTEIAALNGALVREAQALGVPVPFNQTIAWLIEGRELHQRRLVEQPDIDYALLEAQAREEPRP